MNGLETQLEKDRCFIWDLLWKYGPMEPMEIQKRTEEAGCRLTTVRIRTLVEHEWFMQRIGMVHIANMDGSRRLVPKIAACA